MDYSLLRLDEFSSQELDRLPEWDLFISAFNKSERVNRLFDAARAPRKEWLVHPEYQFSQGDLPTDSVVRRIDSRDESQFWEEYFLQSRFDELPSDARICVDLTGFMRPHLMLLPLLLRRRGFEGVDMLYSDPQAYFSGATTSFAEGAVTEVRQVRGFEGTHGLNPNDQDLLVIACGYDDELIRRVAEDKRSARKLQLFGLPSLQPHMYDENRLRAARAEESIGPLQRDALLFAPAHNPFATAQELHDRVLPDVQKGTNVYLSALSTKAQALGFALFYLCECIEEPVSMIFPFAEFYASETSVGLARVRLFRLELDWLRV